jgi:tRNA-Thr(GGU) m(6)t(6)A37 methyltransferase TsaA
MKAGDLHHQDVTAHAEDSDPRGERLMQYSVAMNAIGVIHTPYRRHKEIPIQGRFKDYVEGWVELAEEYRPGLKDLDCFSHAILLYHLHDSDRTVVQGRPYLENDVHGIFAFRGPHRPNHIGLSVVRISGIADNAMFFTYVDMLDGTPLLDIKPYVRYFDSHTDARCGWLDKHFKHNSVPLAAVHKKRSGNRRKRKGGE